MLCPMLDQIYVPKGEFGVHAADRKIKQPVHAYDGNRRGDTR